MMAKRLLLWAYSFGLLFFITSFFLFYFGSSLKEAVIILSLEGLVLCISGLINEIFTLKKEDETYLIRNTSMDFIKYFAKQMQALKKPSLDINTAKHYLNLLEVKASLTYFNLSHYRFVLNKTKQKSFDYFLMNFAEFMSYLQEIDIELNCLDEEENEESYRSSNYYKKESVNEIMDSHLIFLDDYLDILLMDVYPFLDSKDKKRYKYLVDDLKNDN